MNDKGMTMNASEQLNRLIERLREIFEIDKADLDFGIYRIMNIRKKEIEKFLSEGLPKRVQETLAPFAADTTEIEKRILEIEKQLGDGAAIAALPQAIPMVKEYADLKTQLAKGVDLSGLEADVYSHLLSFFSRYYEEGDFISKRRYKEGVYAIPYEGEEVKLYWANQDQYYIKTSENFKDYTFVAEGYTIHFRLVDATTEQNNNKESADSKRVFMLYNETQEQPDIKTFEFDAERKELFIRFTFDIPADKKFDYATDNEKRITTWIANECKPLLFLLNPISQDPKKSLTLLGKHLKAYVAKNTFDYFIHKDLGGFLSRELDFYIKNEVMHLDDVDTTNEKQVASWMAQVRAIKRVGKVIIDFLSQIENFQKKLWLKKKFVVSTNYCITLDRVPETFYEEIAKNQPQWQEWAKLGFCDVEFGNGFTWDNVTLPVTDITVYFDEKHDVAYACDLSDEKLVWIENADLKKEKNGTFDLATPLSSIEFLKKQSNLVLDTKFFSDDFKERLIATIDDFDDQCDGLLIHSENFNALNLLYNLFKGRIQSIYIDPPFNLKENGDFLYRTDYKDSTWASLLYDRLKMSYDLLCNNGMQFIRCDYNGNHLVRFIGNSVFSNDLLQAELLVQRIRKNVTEQGRITLPLANDSLFLYFKSFDSYYIDPYLYLKEPREAYWRRTDDSAGFRNPPERILFGKTFYPYKRDAHFKFSQERMDEMVMTKRIRLQCKKCSFIHTEGTWSVCPKCGCAEATPQYRVEATNKQILDTNWMDIAGYSSSTGFSTENSEVLLTRVINVSSQNNDYIMDYFAGSGTTMAVASKMKRRWIGVEMGNQFFDYILPRLKKIDISHCFKYLSLESYEDALSNIELPDEERTQGMLSLFGDEYLLKYILDLDATGSILNLEAFKEPFNYQLNITEKNETKKTAVDLVETFNYLIGLTVKRIFARRSFNAVPQANGEYEGAVELVSDANGKYTFRQVEGTLRDGQRVLIIWRNISDNLKESNAALDAYFARYRINPADREFSIIYVNGDNNVENLRKDDETWKVRMIEPEFKERMFEEA